MRYPLIIAIAMSTFVSGPSLASEPTIEAQLLSPLGQGFSYVPSPGPVDLVTVGPSGSRLAVYRDGEAGPKFDEIVTTEPTPEGGGGIAVVFSADGSRHAYVGRARDKFTLIVDGEVVATGKYDGSANTVAGVGFNADNYLFYRIRQHDEAGNSPWQFVMDGQPSPALAPSQFQVFLSPVGKGYVLIGTLMETRQPAVIRDGEVIEARAINFIYRHDGKLFTQELDPETNETVLKLEGEELFRGDYAVQEIVPAPAGETWALIGNSRSRGPNARLVVNGEEVHGTVSNMVGRKRIWYSDDGAHWATIMQPQTGRQYVVVDGEPQNEYGAIQEFAFSPDGTRHAYWGRSPTGAYLVIDGEEQDGVSSQTRPVVWGGGGAHVGWAEQATSPERISVLYDGARYVGDHQLAWGSIGLSPDGARMAVLHGPTLVELTNAGVTKHEGFQVLVRPKGSTAHGGYLPMPNGFMFSPDSRLLVTWGNDQQTGRKGILVNGKLAFEAPGIGVLRIGFSPDSRHLFVEIADSGSTRTLYVNGEPVRRSGPQPFEQQESMWHIDESGVLRFMTADNEGIKRVTVTPSADRSFADLIGN